MVYRPGPLLPKSILHRPNFSRKESKMRRVIKSNLGKTLKHNRHDKLFAAFQVDVLYGSSKHPSKSHSSALSAAWHLGGRTVFTLSCHPNQYLVIRYEYCQGDNQCPRHTYSPWSLAKYQQKLGNLNPVQHSLPDLWGGVGGRATIVRTLAQP